MIKQHILKGKKPRKQKQWRAVSAFKWLWARGTNLDSLAHLTRLMPGDKAEQDALQRKVPCLFLNLLAKRHLIEI